MSRYYYVSEISERWGYFFSEKLPKGIQSDRDITNYIFICLDTCELASKEIIHFVDKLGGTIYPAGAKAKRDEKEVKRTIQMVLGKKLFKFEEMYFKKNEKNLLVDDSSKQNQPSTSDSPDDFLPLTRLYKYLREQPKYKMTELNVAFFIRKHLEGLIFYFHGMEYNYIYYKQSEDEIKKIRVEDQFIPYRRVEKTDIFVNRSWEKS